MPSDFPDPRCAGLRDSEHFSRGFDWIRPVGPGLGALGGLGVASTGVLRCGGPQRSSEGSARPLWHWRGGVWRVNLLALKSKQGAGG